MRYEIELNRHICTGIVCDSRQADADTAFAALVGAKSDGHDYVRAAYDRGCRVFILQRRVELPDDAEQIIYPDTRIALAGLSAQLYGYPARRLKMIGITGTKGKSTTAALIHEMLNSAGYKAALIGTTGIFIGENYTPSVNTTPESNILHRAFAEALEAGCTHMVMEVSSQAFKLNRVYGIGFDMGIFTNLSPDHISDIEHKDYMEYRACKAQLFESSAISIINGDDGEAGFMSAHSAGDVVTFGTKGGENLTAHDITLTNTGSCFDIGGMRCSLPLPGRFNISNALAAVAVLRCCGAGKTECASLLSKVHPVKGRLERVGEPADRMFVIDYAHNGISLSLTLETLREYKPRRLVCLFGSIGGRAELRRRELAEAAAKYADLSIITTDNPDFEDENKIIDEIASFMGSAEHIKITDRGEAVRYAVRNSRPGDIVLFAGKGHEDYQIINGEHVYFCEREIIEDELKKLK